MLVTLALTCTLVASAGAAATKGAVGTAGDPLHAPECRAAIAVPAPMPTGTIAHRAPPIAPTRAPIPGPRTVTSCDAGGCWTSDGTRVDRFGPDLRDRRGVCTLSGAVLRCP